MSRSVSAVASIWFVLLTSACAATADQADTAAATEPATADGSDDAGGVDPGGVCAQYIECVAAVAPHTVAAAVEGFGPEGTCWTPETTDVCTDACTSARQELGELFPTETACWDCQTDDDCDEDGTVCSEGICATPNELSDTFLLALDLSIAPGLPLQYIAETSITNDEVTFTLQPLSLHQGSTTSPREEIGDPIVLVGTLSGETFQVSFESGLLVIAAANPIAGSDMVIDLAMTGELHGSDSWCGTVSGDIRSPIQASLDGSSFAAVRLASRDERPATFPLSCAQWVAKCDPVDSAGNAVSHMPLNSPELSRPELVAVLRDWIAAGAPDN